MPPSLNYPNIRLGIPYLEINVRSENKYQKRIEYLADTIIEEINSSCCMCQYNLVV